MILVKGCSNVCGKVKFFNADQIFRIYVGATGHEAFSVRLEFANGRETYLAEINGGSPEENEAWAYEAAAHAARILAVTTNGIADLTAEMILN